MLLPLSKLSETWTEEDLRKLCEEKIPENQRLDYKRELKIDPVRERRELLKDITSFANSFGGVIIYGIDEVKHPDLGSIASSLCPLTEPDLIDRATRIVRTSVSPGIEFYFYRVEASQGGYYLVVNIPQSRNKPHAVVWEKRIDYYVRRNQDNVPLSEPEVRDIYMQSYLATQSLEQRYKSLDFNISAKAQWSLVSMPVFSTNDMIDTLSTTGQVLTKASYVAIFGSSDCLKARVDRFEETFQYPASVVTTRLFQNGEFMISEGYPTLDQVHRVDVPSLYRYWYLSLKYYTELYADLGYFGPIRIWLETTNFNHDYIRIGFRDRVTGAPCKRQTILVWRESNVDSLREPRDICNAFTKYMAQACDIFINDNYLRDLEAEIR